LNVLGVSSLPDWYFNDSQEERESARNIYDAFIELDHLIRNHSAELMMQVKAAYPRLWSHVFGTNQAIQQRYTFSEILSKYSTKTDPQMRLKDLQEHIRSQNLHKILWAISEERYEAVLCGLRAQVQMELAGDPNLQRGETQLHRRKSDLIAQLMQLLREQKTVSLSARQDDRSHAQVITYKSSSHAFDEAGAENSSVTANVSSASDAQKA
jgi:phosphopantetheinyl transferase (holo-ACP synthase)